MRKNPRRILSLFSNFSSSVSTHKQPVFTLCFVILWPQINVVAFTHDKCASRPGAFIGYNFGYSSEVFWEKSFGYADDDGWLPTALITVI